MKNLFIIVLIIIVLIGGYSLLKPKNSVMVKETSMVDKGSMATSTDTNQMMGDTMVKSGSYEVYSPEKLIKANTGKVVLFFRASWCPTCRALDTDIRSNLKNIPESVTLLDVDYDNSTSLKKKYGVTYQHTLVEVNADGSMIKKWAGSPTLTSLVKEII